MRNLKVTKFKFKFKNPAGIKDFCSESIFRENLKTDNYQKF